jgi:hypothetical protein
MIPVVGISLRQKSNYNKTAVDESVQDKTTAVGMNLYCDLSDDWGNLCLSITARGLEYVILGSQ